MLKETIMRTGLLITLLAWAMPVLAQTRPVSDPINSLPKDTIVAMIDGEAITLGDLEAYSKDKQPRQLFQLNQQLFEFRESMLGLMLGERLLKAEADKAGMTVDELLQKVLTIEAVTDADVQEVLTRQPPGQLDPAVVTPLIRQFLEDRKREEARARYVNEVVAKAKKAPRPVVIRLQPPRLSVPTLSTDPTHGTGPIEVVEFSDFECPYCREFQPVLREVLEEFDGKVTHVWKDLPLPMHANAVPAAMAARCAHDQGQFWEYHDALFAHQQALGHADLKKHARELKLNAEAFDACLDGGKHRDLVHTARQLASAAHVLSTPTLLINGRLVSGVRTKEDYTRIINAELEARAD
jgi:protein-disulfide isomerase